MKTQKIQEEPVSNDQTLNVTTTNKNENSKHPAVYLSSPLPLQVTEQSSPSLYPPGRILHIVRKYPKHEDTTKKQGKVKPTLQIIDADNHNFNELLISPRMLQDHMPQSVLNAMKAVS